MAYLKEKTKILAANTSQFFTQHLSQRGFRGYISFNHKQETLELIVSVIVFSILTSSQISYSWRNRTKHWQVLNYGTVTLFSEGLVIGRNFAFQNGFGSSMKTATNTKITT